MRIGLNLVFLTPGETGGMETYARQLIPELVAAAPEHEFIAFVNRDAAAAPGPWGELIGAVTVPVHARERVQWVRGEQQLLPRLAGRARIDLLHSLASTAPVWGPFRRVVTIHDLIYRTLPEAHPGLRSVGMRVLVPLAARRSDRIIAPSQATGHDVISALRVPATRVDVIPEGIGSTRASAPTPEAQLRGRLQAGNRPLVISVSAKLAHKNLITLLDAWATISAAQRPILVLPGYPTPHEAQLRAHAGELDIAGDVRFLGWVSAADLEGLYAAACGAVFPTLAEGFGLPVLEAMVRGVPVACSDIPVLREVAGDAAIMFDPRSPSAIADAVHRLTCEPALRSRLAAAGPQRAAGFSWRTAAKSTLASYRLAVS